ncbi:MAG: hypothetical protein WD023_10385 [Ilumatobacteraceae bacterium]
MIRHRLTICCDEGRLVARPFWRRGKVLTLSLTEPGLELSMERSSTITLPWAAYVPDSATSSLDPAADSWTISWWTSGQAGRFGVAIVVRGVFIESTRAIAASTQTRWRAFDLRRSGHTSGVALPVLPGASEFTRYEAERSTMSALCHVMRDRADLRPRLGEQARMDRLAREVQRDLLPLHAAPARPGQAVADVLGAMRQAGYVHRFGRPLSRAEVERSALVVDEVRSRILADPHRRGRPIDNSLVERLVRTHYLDVKPWPFTAITGPV